MSPKIRDLIAELEKAEFKMEVGKEATVILCTQM